MILGFGDLKLWTEIYIPYDTLLGKKTVLFTESWEGDSLGTMVLEEMYKTRTF